MSRLRWWVGVPTALVAALLYVDADASWKAADWLTNLTHRIRGRLL